MARLASELIFTVSNLSRYSDRILDHLSTLADESFFLTQVAVVVALGQMETIKAEVDPSS